MSFTSTEEDYVDPYYYDRYYNSVYVSNSGKISDKEGLGRDLCFTTEGKVITTWYQRPVMEWEPALIALAGSMIHTTHHQRSIIQRLLSEENYTADLDDYEGCEPLMFPECDPNLIYRYLARVKKLSTAIRRGVVSGTFRSTRELSNMLRFENQDLIIQLKEAICTQYVKGALCFVECCQYRISGEDDDSSEDDDGSEDEASSEDEEGGEEEDNSGGEGCSEDKGPVIELKKGAYIEDGADWFHVCSGGVLLIGEEDLGWFRLSRSGNVYHVEQDTFSRRCGGR